jgi:ParB family chromosome partitioning protein
MEDLSVQGAQMDPQPRRRLGRGLSALLGGAGPAADNIESRVTGDLRHVLVEAIERNPWQPRKDFDAEGMRELTESIREHGVLQPILVRALSETAYQLIAGERRWQAARHAGLSTIPCRVVDVIDQTACEYALEENLKRKDLNDLEKAQAFREYLNHFGTTIEELARQLSMSRSAVSNLLRLLDLAEPVKSALLSGQISTGHARALLSLSEADQAAMCTRIQSESLNVRQTERAVRDFQPAPPPDVLPLEALAEADKPEISQHVLSLQEHLRQVFGVKVEIRLKGKDRGQIVLPFNSNDEFEAILHHLRRPAA